jgi:hypothetical protein
MMSGTNGPRMLVRKEITKKIRKTSKTIPMLRFMASLHPLNCDFNDHPEWAPENRARTTKTPSTPREHEGIFLNRFLADRIAIPNYCNQFLGDSRN